MNHRTFIILTAFLAGSVCEVYSAPLLPEKLAYQVAPIQQVIPYRDGVIVKAHDIEADNVMFARFDAKETTPVEVEGMQLVFDAEQTADGVVFLGLQGKKIVVVKETAGGERHAVTVPNEFHPQFLEDLGPSTRPLLIPTNNEIAAIAGDVVWWLNKEWKSRKLPQAPPFYRDFKPGNMGEVHYLDGTTLYAGWDKGEWGGMLASIDLSAPDPVWHHLSGKVAGDTSGIPHNNPVTSIVSLGGGNIWVATGLAHMTVTLRGLYHRDPHGKWHTLIDGELDDDWGKLKLPVASPIEALAVNHAGKLYILASQAGIFRLGKTKLEPLFKHDFFSHSSELKDNIMGSFTVCCYPSSLGLSRNGDIFISTNNFGVLAFREVDGKWSGHQITLNKRSAQVFTISRPANGRYSPKRDKKDYGFAGEIVTIKDQTFRFERFTDCVGEETPDYTGKLQVFEDHIFLDHPGIQFPYRIAGILDGRPVLLNWKTYQAWKKGNRIGYEILYLQKPEVDARQADPAKPESKPADKAPAKD